jgi:hypothetical protein
MVKWVVPDGLARSTTHLIVPDWTDTRVVSCLDRCLGPARLYFFMLQNIVYIYIYLNFIFTIYNKHTRVLLVSLLRVAFSGLGVEGGEFEPSWFFGIFLI